MKNIIVLFLFISVYVSYSQWENVGWPKDVSINTMITTENKIIIGTQKGVKYSTDQGKTWVNTNLTNYINNFAQSDNEIVASNAGGAVYISHNEGVSWNMISSAVIKNGIISLAIDGTNIIAGSYQSAEVYFSTDLGITWESKSSGLPNNNDLAISSIAKIDDNIFISIYNTVVTSGGGLFLSTDMGNTWSIKGFSNQNVSRVFLNGGKLFAYSGKLLISSDLGNTWEPLAFNKGINDIVTDGNIIYAGTYSGVYFSEDKGITWIEKGLTNQSIHSISFLENRLITSSSGGIYLFDGQNNKWGQLYEVKKLGKVKSLSVYENKIFACNEDKIFQSSDFGVSWDEINANNNDQVSIDAINGKLYLGSNNGLYISTDLGISWTKQNTADSLLYKAKISSVVNVENNIFAATNFGIFISEDNGINWFYENNELSLKSVKSIIAIGNQLYASFRNVYTSTDLGKSWEIVNNGLPESQTSPDLTTDGTGKVIAGYQSNGENSGVYLSDNKGDSWKYISNDGFIYDNVKIKEVLKVFAIDNYIFAYPKNMGVFISDDSGQTWNSINKGLTNLKVNSFEKIGNYVIIGTEDGFYRAELSAIIESDVSDNSDVSSTLIYPNPAKTNVSIDFIVEPENLPNISVELYNLTGILQAKLVYNVDYNDSIGQCTLNCNIENIPNGYYIIVIDNGKRKVAKPFIVNKE